MLVWIVSLACAFKLADIIPLEALIVSSRSRIINWRWVFKDCWTWSCWAETRNLIITFVYFNGEINLPLSRKCCWVSLPFLITASQSEDQHMHRGLLHIIVKNISIPGTSLTLSWRFLSFRERNPATLHTIKLTIILTFLCHPQFWGWSRIDQGRHLPEYSIYWNQSFSDFWWGWLT